MRAVELYRSGLSIVATAAQLKTSSRHVRRVLHAAGEVRSKREMYCGEGNPAWRGGRTVDKTGYVLRHLPTHPYANCNGYVREHRLVMERTLGRFLLPQEVVHHVDGDHANNVSDNLVVYASNGAHLADELQGRVPKWSDEGYARMLASARRKKVAARRRRQLL